MPAPERAAGGPFPLGAALLGAVMVLVYLLALASTGRLAPGAPAGPSLLAALLRPLPPGKLLAWVALSLPLSSLQEVPRLLSAPFIHLDGPHLGGNLAALFLCAAGRSGLERRC